MGRRLLVLSILFILLGKSSYAQGTALLTSEARDCTRGELKIRERISSIAVLPSGRIWLKDMLGSYLYYTDSVNGDWSYGPFHVDTNFFHLDYRFNNLSFFNNDTAIATKNVHPDDVSQFYVYRTTNGWKTIDSVRIKDPESSYTVFMGESGEAFLHGSSGRVWHTHDYGLTWTSITAPFGKWTHLNGLFVTPSGYGIAAARANLLKRTDDGGRTWKSIPAPYTQIKSSSPAGYMEISRIGMLGNLLVVRQNGEVFYTSKDTVLWKQVPNVNLLTFAVDERRQLLVGITDSLNLVTIDSLLQLHAFSAVRLPSAPVDMVVRNGNVYVFDVTDGMSVISPERYQFGYPQTSSHRTGKMYFARGWKDQLLGFTSNGVYNSDDKGQSWCRIATMNFQIKDALVTKDDEIMLWDEHGHNVVLNRTNKTVSAIPDLEDADVVNIIRTPGLWVAFGGMQYETSYRVEVAQTFFGGQFRGSKPYGFVYVSKDSGKGWKMVDKWDQGGVMDVFVARNGDMMLTSYLGSIRRLVKMDSTYVGLTMLTANNSNREQVPYVQTPSAFYFTNELEGYINGSIHHVGDRYFKTSDGGKSWKRIEESIFPYVRIMPVSKGYLAFTYKDIYLLDGSTKKSLTPTDINLNPREMISEINDMEEGKALVEITEYTMNGALQRWVVVRY